jgi:hypothetical protein
VHQERLIEANNKWEKAQQAAVKCSQKDTTAGEYIEFAE